MTLFRPFLEYLAASNLSPKTIQKHVDNMWVLGGEFIRDLHNDPSLRKTASGASPSPNDRVRRPAPLSRRRRSAEILRFHLPKAPAIPHRDGSLTLAVTHKFPRRGTISVSSPVRPLRADTPDTPAKLKLPSTLCASTCECSQTLRHTESSMVSCPPRIPAESPQFILKPTGPLAAGVVLFGVVWGFFTKVSRAF